MNISLSKSFVLIFLCSTLSFLGMAQTISWTRRAGPTGGTVKDVEYDPATGKVYTLIENKVYVSSNDGATWTALTFSGSDKYFYDIEITNGSIYLIDGYDLHVSSDGGVTFPKRNTDNILSSAYRIKRLSSGTLVAVASNRVYYSTSNGVTWTAGESGSFNQNYLAVNNLDQVFVIGSTGLPLRSIDGGVSFTNPITNTGITAGGTVFSLTANNTGSLIYCVNAAGLWSSPNGNTWTSIKGGAISDATVSSNTTNASFLEFSGDGLGMYFIDNINKKLYYKGLSETVANWQLSAGFPGTTLPVIAASAKSYATPATSTAVFGTFIGLYKTTTGGGTIFEANSGILGVKANKIVPIDNGDLIMQASSIGLLRSSDKGDSWTRISTLPSSIFYTSTNSTGDNIFAATNYPDYFLYRSQDKGITWSSLTLPAAAAGFRWASGSDNNRVFGLSTNNTSFYYSNNNGTNWTASAIAISGLPSSFSFYEYSINLASSNKMLVQLYNSTTSTYEYWRIDFTIGSGLTISGAATKIQTFLPFANISKITAANGMFYAYSGSTDQIATSANGAASSWTIVSAPNTSGYMFVANNGYVFFASNPDDKLYISRDNGATFGVDTSLPATVDPNQIEDVAIDLSGFAYLAMDLELTHRSSITIVTPAAPSALAVAGKTATAVALKWTDNSSYESYYQVEKSTDGTNFTTVGQFRSSDICSNGTSFTGYFVAQGLTASTAYTFRVKAVNDAGSSSAITLGVTTLASSAISIPDNRSWDAVNSGETGNAVVSSKIVSVKHLGGGKYEVSDISLGVITSYTTRRETFYESSGQTMLITTNGYDPVKPNVNGAWNGTNSITLKWRECYDTDYDNVNDTETITLTLRATDPAPAAPAGVTALVNSNTTIEVSWVQGYYEKEYVVERSLTSGSGYSEIATVQYPSTKYVDNGPFTNGTTYYYRVKSRNANVAPMESTYSVVTSAVFQKPNFIISNTTVSNLVASTIGSYWADFNNDGADDLLFLSYDFTTDTGTPTMFKNLGNGNFVQVPITLDPEKYLFGLAADINNDGFIDIGLAVSGSPKYDIYKGNGDFTFTKLTDLQKGDVATSLTNEVFTSSAVDFNKDGRLDLLLLSSDSDPGNEPVLLKQNVNGSFTKVAGGDLALETHGYASASWADYDNDGDQDFVLANTNGACELYKNNGDETFTLTSGIGFDATSAYSFAWGDYNNDGFLDLYSGAFAKTALYKNNGNGTFTKDESTSISEPYQGLTSLWSDINNDGLLDLVTTGVFSSATRIFINTSTSTTSFTKITTEKISDSKNSHYGMGYYDYDKDGFVDLFLPSFYFAPSGSDDILPLNAYLFKNNNSTGNWTQIKLSGIASNKKAVGARVIVTAGGKTYIREIASIAGVSSQSSSVVHVGIGSATAITNIKIKWPSGATQDYANPPINQILSIPEDNQGPVVVLQSPSVDAINVSYNSTVEITFDEAVNAVAGKNLVITAEGDASPLASIAVTGAVVSAGNKYTFTSPTKFAANKKYNVTIDVGAFTDLYGNAFAGITTGWSFTTSAGAHVSTLTPANGATGVAASTILSMQFDQSVTAVTGKAVKLFVKSDLVNPAASLDATAGTFTGNKVTFTLPAKLLRETVYVVSVEAGGFVDASSNDFAGIATTAWEFTSDVGPGAATFLPANSAVGVAINAGLEVTFNKAITAVAGKKIKVMDGTTELLNVDVSTNGTVAGVKYSIAAPTAGWPYLKNLEVTIEPGAFIDASQNDFKGILSAQWKFTTVEATDVIAPVIAFTPIASIDKGFSSTTLTTTITDDKGVSSARMFKRGVSASALTEIAGTLNANGKWEFVVPETAFDASGLQYYFSAKDAANNEARDPATGYYKTNLKYPSTIEVTTALGFGGSKSNWKIFTFPFEASNSIASVFDELTGETKIDYRILTYKDQSDWLDYPSFTSFTRGVGYFVNIKTSKVVSLPANLVAPSNTRDNLFKINLKKGWNMIGNPYLSQIAWADVAAFNSLTGQSAQFQIYNGSKYVASTSAIDPYTGGFVFVADDIAVSVPFLGQTTAGGRLKEISFSEGEWILPLTLMQGETENDFGGVGMHNEAVNSFDDLDRVNTPHFLDYIDMNFSHPEHFAKEFARDVVPVMNNYMWEFTVDASQKDMALLKWNNEQFMSANELFLFDVDQQKPINMKEVNSYSFDPVASSRFLIYFGQNVKTELKPDRIMLGHAVPNPAKSSALIPFNLPDAQNSYQVSLEVFDAMGKKISTLVRADLKPGFYQSQWTTTDHEVANGLYIYRLIVGANQKQEVLSGKIIVNK